MDKIHILIKYNSIGIPEKDLSFAFGKFNQSDHTKEEIKPDVLLGFTGQSKRSVYRKIKSNTGLSLMQ